MRIGIDLGGTKIEGVVLDDNNQVIHRIRRATPATDYSKILTSIDAMISDLEAEVRQTCSVGIGTPGAISPHSGLLKNSNTTVLNGRHLREDLESLTGRNLFLANDANCFALSEAVDGAASDANIVFGVIIGTGTGGGLVIDGKVLVGANAIAGEWGHNPLPWPDNSDLPTICYCGKVGCIETYLSGAGLSRLHTELGGEQLSAEQIAKLVDLNDSLATRALEIYAERFARAVAGVINIIDPNAIVLGGGLSKIKSLPALIEKNLPKFVFTDYLTTRVVTAAHGDSSGVRGAAWLARDQSFLKSC